MPKQYQGVKRFVDPETNKDVYMNMIENDDSKRNGRFFITHLAMICMSQEEYRVKVCT